MKQNVTHMTNPGQDEKAFMEFMDRGLRTEFPNPDRIGCLDPKVLRDIASHRMALAKAEPYFIHLTTCSPCYRDFCHIRDAAIVHRKRTLLAVAASILVVASILSVSWFERHHERQFAQGATIDLRAFSVPRGSGPSPGTAPLQIDRTARRWTIYLPLGSSNGHYDVRIMSPSGIVIATATGVAAIQDYATVLVVPMSTSSASPGRYVLQIRKNGVEDNNALDWNSFPAVLR
ncbi:MAG TPA: hypothetical protein VNO32_00790 [Candidatus Acidoferrum sp.]|nr:hypothetical protein [Candidatus Acidoferrum sp.]